MMMGLHFMDEVPFHDGLHPRARSRRARARRCRSRRATSSTRSTLIDKYGADALRFTLAAMAAQGRDIKLAGAARRGLSQLRHQAVERGALRQMNELRRASKASIRRPLKDTVNRWIERETAPRARRGDGGAGGVSLQRSRRRALPVRVERLLRLVSRIHQAGADRGRARQDETRATAAWVAGPDPASAASVHAVHHRRALGVRRASRGQSAKEHADGSASAWPDYSKKSRATRPRAFHCNCCKRAV